MASRRATATADVYCGCVGAQSAGATAFCRKDCLHCPFLMERFEVVRKTALSGSKLLDWTEWETVLHSQAPMKQSTVVEAVAERWAREIARDRRYQASEEATGVREAGMKVVGRQWWCLDCCRDCWCYNHRNLWHTRLVHAEAMGKVARLVREMHALEMNAQASRLRGVEASLERAVEEGEGWTSLTRTR